MIEKLEMPYLDKAIGLGSERQDQQGQFEAYLTNKIKSEGGKFIEGLEQEKT